MDKLTYDGVIRRQQSDIVQRYSSAITIIEFHGDKLRIQGRIGGARFGHAPRVQAAVLLTPVSAQSGTGDQLLGTLGGDFDDLRRANHL